MQSTQRNPRSGIYPATEDYVHAMEISGATRFLFVSGTMALMQNAKRQQALKTSHRSFGPISAASSPKRT
jgi:hypothetical protein